MSEARGAAPARRPLLHGPPLPIARAPAYVFLAAVVVFIIYGSLFPFDFANQGLPLARFFAEDQLFGRWSDAIDNFLLFVPLGVALHLSFRRPGARAAAALLALLVLAIGIQLVQLYLPSRIASLSDAFWNTIGMGAGLLAAPRAHRAWLAQVSARPAARDNFLLLLVALWFLYESYPFIPTLDFGLLRAHLKGAVFAPPFEPVRLVQHGLAAMLSGIAVTRFGLLRLPMLGAAGLGALALTLEVLVPYGSLRRETLIGIVLGLAAGYLVAQRWRERSAGAAFLLALSAFLLTVFSPYRGQALDAGFSLLVKELPPTAFEALAIGAMLWSGMAGGRAFHGRPYLWSALVLLLLALLEAVRVGVAGIHGDSTTLLMALLLAPAAAVLRTSGAPIAPGAPAMPATPRAESVAARGRRPALAMFAASLTVLTVAVWMLPQVPGVPYNLKDLFWRHSWAGAAEFSLALLWIGAGPWLVVRTVLHLDARRRHGILLMPLMLAGIALVAFALIDEATPAIMLNKIIGAPDLYRRIVEENYWGEAWRAGLAEWPRGLVRLAERIVRFVALYSVFSIPLALAALALAPADRRARLIVGVLWLAPFWLLAKVVVLDWAITDNLTELVADGGAIYLAALVALFSANAVALAAYRCSALRLALATAASAAVGWWLLNQGIEAAVLNNGRLFSGVQFLLGQDRVALLSAPALFGRWCLAYGPGLVVVATGMVLSMRLWPPPST